MEKSVPDRLNEFIKYLKISVSEFERNIGASNGLISKYINGGSKSLGSEKIETILRLYPNLNTKWLFSGLENMLNENINLENLHNSNNSVKKENEAENPKILEKSNKTENGDDNKNDNRHDNNGYILEENQGSDRVEEEAVQSHKIIKQPISQVINQGLSPPEAEILKERIQSLKEILKSKEEVLKAKDKHIELLEDKIKTLQNQVNNPLRVGENNIRDAA